ncbi:MAG: lytic transglycosylase domain-containing protein [bacterium]|nr:lytic transglycosylase domain-containing protein [bacterium]
MGIRRLTPASLATLLLLGGASAAPAAAEEPLRYYRDGATPVLSNTTGRADTRALPGYGRHAAEKGSLLPASPYDPQIERAAGESGLPASLVKAVALVESAFDPNAVSPKGAQGLMQLMPSTARQYGVDDAFDPMQNLRAGATHLRHLLDTFEGDLTLALAAYNAGEGAVRRHGGVPAYRETRNYVRKIHEHLGRTPRPSRKRVPQAQRVRMVVGDDGSVLLTN